MVRAYHIVFCTYGFWLPNDERGSWSDFVRRYELYVFGHATKTTSRRSVAAKPFDHARAAAAREALSFPPVVLSGEQARAVAQGFNQQQAKSGYRIHACAILSDHIHLVIARHHYKIEQVENLLKGAATRQLADMNLHPLAHHQDARGQTPSPWAVGFWRVYLNTDTDITRAIRYVEMNPIRAKLRPQRYGFVTPFEPGPLGRR